MSGDKKETIIRHRGRIRQVPICLGKLFRQFIFLNDWKVIPMSALVAGVVSIVVSADMFQNMEGTLKGALALACICIWNGFFNSIQSVCRERDIVKREHRNGMHISAYIAAQMIYQTLICLIQTFITMKVCAFGGMKFPTEGIVFKSFTMDIGLTLFLITYSADMMALMISCIAKNTTSAMTIMPFMLIYELVFSDTVFVMSGRLSFLSGLSVAKWGSRCIAALSNYNSLPMVSMWNLVAKMQSNSSNTAIMDAMNRLDKDQLCAAAGKLNQNAAFATTYTNIFNCWMNLFLFAMLFVIIGTIVLERIDKDKR